MLTFPRIALQKLTVYKYSSVVFLGQLNLTGTYKMETARALPIYIRVTHMRDDLKCIFFQLIKINRHRFMKEVYELEPAR